jgi:DNA-binding NarL/FixJ family response regulator
VLKSIEMRPRIVIVDDDASFLATVRLLLESEGFVVVGEARNGLDALAAVQALEPDIVLVDVTLPDIDGFQVVERLAEGGYASPVVLTSIRSAEDFGDLVQRSSAHGFITKAELSGEALAQIVAGRSSSV